MVFALSFHDNEIVIVNVILVLTSFDRAGIGGVSVGGGERRILESITVLLFESTKMLRSMVSHSSKVTRLC